MTQLHPNLRTFNFDALPDIAYVRLNQLLAGVLPFSASTTWRKVRSGQFPQPVKISCQVTAWRVADVRRWLADPEGYSAADVLGESNARRESLI